MQTSASGMKSLLLNSSLTFRCLLFVSIALSHNAPRSSHAPSYISPLFLFSFFSSSSLIPPFLFRKKKKKKIRTASEYRAMRWKIRTNQGVGTGLGSRTVWRGTLRLDSLYRYPLQTTRRLGANEWSRRKPLVRLAPRTGMNWDNSRYLFPSSNTTHPSTVALKTTHFS